MNEGAQFQVERSSPAEHPVEKFIYCLSIDMIGSTKAGLEMPTSMIDRFNREFVGQIKPHLEQLELHDVLIKYGGDGWLWWPVTN